MKTNVFGFNDSWKNATNKALELLQVRDKIQVGILTVEPNTKLPSEGFSAHEVSHEFGYVIEGSVVIGTDEYETEVKEGDLMYNKPGTPHYTANKSLKPAKILWFLAPPLK